MAGLGKLQVRAIERTRHVHLVENYQAAYLATLLISPGSSHIGEAIHGRGELSRGR
jgi:hypothetical protein